jgi:hypothetical protein
MLISSKPTICGTLLAGAVGAVVAEEALGAVVGAVVSGAEGGPKLKPVIVSIVPPVVAPFSIYSDVIEGAS